MPAAERNRVGQETGRQLLRAHSMVQLVGSDSVRAAANVVNDAAVRVGVTLEPRNIDSDAADAASGAIFAAVNAFIDAVLPETAS
jgi:hypothetical protein